MGFLFHSHYASYYEIGRTESIRQLGLSYLSMEEAGVMMPVTDLNMRFLLPAHYDELITVHSVIEEMPVWRMKIIGEMINEQNQVINRTEVRLAFIDAKTRRIRQAPDMLTDKFKPFFD